MSDNTSVNRCVISEAILRCLQLLFETKNDESILHSINTDGFYIPNPKVTCPNKKDTKFKLDHIGNAFITDSKPT